MSAIVCVTRRRHPSRCRRRVLLALVTATAIPTYPLAAQQRSLGNSLLTLTRPTDNAWALEWVLGIGKSPARSGARPDWPMPQNADRVPGIAGALIGGAVGAGLGAIYAQGSCESRDCDGAGAGAKDGALWGAAIGATIDVLAWLKSRRERTNRGQSSAHREPPTEVVRRAGEVARM